jgi:hypothetical protein
VCLLKTVVARAQSVKLRGSWMSKAAALAVDGWMVGRRKKSDGEKGVEEEVEQPKVAATSVKSSKPLERTLKLNVLDTLRWTLRIRPRMTSDPPAANHRPRDFRSRHCSPHHIHASIAPFIIILPLLSACLFGGQHDHATANLCMDTW